MERFHFSAEPLSMLWERVAVCFSTIMKEKISVIDSSIP